MLGGDDGWWALDALNSGRGWGCGARSLRREGVVGSFSRPAREYLTATVTTAALTWPHTLRGLSHVSQVVIYLCAVYPGTAVLPAVPVSRDPLLPKGVCMYGNETEMRVLLGPMKSRGSGGT